MAVQASDIKYYKSSETNSSGGTITVTEVTDNTLGNLFPTVTASEAELGSITYRKIFVKNTHASDSYIAVKVYISQLTTSSDDEFDLALGDASDTDPSGLSFTRPTSYAGGITIGDLAASASQGIWIRRTVTAGAEQVASNFGQISCKGETA